MTTQKYLYRPVCIGLLLALVVALAVLSPKPLAAQQFFGSIVGTVTDTSGAVVPGATVTLTNKATGEKHAATSNGSGEYQFVDLVPATYSVVVERTSFKRFVSDSVTVEVNQTVRVNAALQIGAATETVEVNMAATVELQTDSGTVSNKVEEQQMNELPLNGRNVMQLLSITAGVMDTSATESGATAAQNGGTSSNPKSFGGGANLYIINGGDNEEYLDGAPINMLQGSNMGLVPTGDDIQEFAVDTSASDSSEGRATGGIINFTSKSGTNNFHGTMYDYFRNTDLNANNFFSNQQGLARGVFNQNQYGFNLGFPVKKDKIFFFGSYEVDDVLTSTPISSNVPGNGNANSNGSNIYNGVFTRSIVDPLSGGPPISTSQIVDTCQITHNAVAGTWTLNPGVYGTPGGCIDPTAAVLKTFWAEQPNDYNAATKTNFAVNVPGGDTAPQMNARMDFIVSPKQRIFAHTAWWAPLDKPLILFPNPNVPSALPGNAPWGLGMQVGGFNSNLYILGDTYTFNPKTVLDLRAEWVRFRFSKIVKVTNFNLGGLGSNWAPLQQYSPAGAQYIPGVTFGTQAENLFPAFGLGAPTFTSGVANSFGTTGQGQQWDNYGLNGTLTRVFGRHSVKFGFEDRLMDMEVPATSFTPGNPSFSISYSCTYSGASCASGTGDEWAELLMGYFGGVTFGGSYGGAEFNYYQAYFGSDSWQVTPKLTVNLGLRYELPGSLYERKNHTLVLQPYTTDPTTGANGTEALVASAQSPSRATTAIKHDDFDPRIGVAYRLDNKTVVRGGFGISAMAVDEDGGGNGSAGSAVSSSSLGWTNPSGSGQVPTATLQDPITASAIYVPPMFHTNPAFLQVLAQANQTSGGVSMAGNYLKERLPYFEEYNFAVQRQIGNSFQITAAYVGSHGLELNAGGSIDEIVGPGNPYGLPAQYTVAGTGSSEVATSTVAAPGVTGAGDPAGTNLTSTVTSSQTTIYTPNGQGGIVQSPNQKGVYCTPGYTAPPAGATSFNGFCAASVKVGAVLQPYPNYKGASISNLAYADQHYNGLQVTTTWRIPGGGLIGSAFTFAKTIGDNINYQDYYNHRADRTVQGVPSRLVINFNYPLPIGQGQRFLNVGGPVSYIVSGWAINDVTSFQHGGYLALTSNTKTAIPGAGTTRATYVPSAPGCNSTKKINGSAVARLGKWFNTSCFAGVSQNVGGTVYMGSYDWGNENAQDPKLFAQGIDNSDISLAKTTKVAEKYSVIFRMETFNTFNRFEAAAPTSLAAGNGSFGVVTGQANNPRQVQLSLRVTY